MVVLDRRFGLILVLSCTVTGDLLGLVASCLTEGTGHAWGDVFTVFFLDVFAGIVFTLLLGIVLFLEDFVVGLEALLSYVI